MNQIPYSPTKQFIDISNKVINHLINKGIPAPHMYPTLSGGIQAEWDTNKFTVEARFEDINIVRLNVDPKNDATSNDIKLPVTNIDAITKWLSQYF